MTFNELHRDTDCNCIENAKADEGNVFARRITGEKAIANDFKSYWDEGRTVKDGKNCELVCDHKGVSVYVVNDETEIQSKFKEIKAHKRMSTRFTHYCLLKLKNSAGLLKQSGKDKAHYNFFKSDDFQIDKLEIIAIRPI
ncbi:hypothetical protein [Candidatus Magnetomonas plexicatena]|uniref:hypothetical protein n=1 Tax=Candidatus Magnetomonas plexicatena TaxID=2552947 RepID=UPI001102F3C3|nr:hypothetical protein E2O03_013410 [Nitrospirales bacterium LBB_01]